jgi:hypothetical protein
MGMSNRDKELGLEGRFWEKVMPIPWSGCWEWMGSTQRYGHFRYPGGQLAHRFSWELENGPVPEGLHVLHKCDNPSCVNPDHLFLGTHDDNMKDKAAKGRAPGMSGEEHPGAKFDWEKVEYIRTCGKRSRELAVEFDCYYTYIDQIKRGDVWTNPPGQTLKKSAS